MKRRKKRVLRPVPVRPKAEPKKDQNATLIALHERLQEAKRQEDVDLVVKAARNSELSDDDFQAFCRKAIGRRMQLPEREP